VMLVQDTSEGEPLVEDKQLFGLAVDKFGTEVVDKLEVEWWDIGWDEGIGL